MERYLRDSWRSVFCNGLDDDTQQGLRPHTVPQHLRSVKHRVLAGCMVAHLPSFLAGQHNSHGPQARPTRHKSQPLAALSKEGMENLVLTASRLLYSMYVGTLTTI